ncbi:MAG: nuclear transport factor 2 family protein [bacterium]|nr:nuclear transport factor 2 family protein [bacterium]
MLPRPRNLTAALLGLLAIAAVSMSMMQDPARQNPAAPTQPNPDRAAVVRAGLDYVHGLYDAKPELIERSVHPELQKFGFYRSKPGAPYQPSPMTFEQLVKLAGKWNASGKRANAESVKRVEVLDLIDQTAVLKVTAVWGIDHMQLAKFDGKWMIRHILWQSHPPKKQ